MLNPYYFVNIAAGDTNVTQEKSGPVAHKAATEPDLSQLDSNEFCMAIP